MAGTDRFRAVFGATFAAWQLAVAAALGLTLLAVAWGFHRWRRWAWLGALIFTGVALLRFVAGMAAPLWGGTLYVDLVPLVTGALVFHVWLRRREFLREPG